MSAPVIEMHNLSRRFGQNLSVDDLSLEVSPGEIFGFLGHNGAGKTTTIRLLNGVLEATSGCLRVLGLDPQADGHALRSRTGVLTKTPCLDERLIACNNLAIYANLYGVPPGKINGFEEFLAWFDLSTRSNEKVSKYSKGMLYTPTTDRELFLGKLLSAWIPALALALIGFALYSLMVNLASGKIMEEFFFPNLMWAVMIALWCRLRLGWY